MNHQHTNDIAQTEYPLCVDMSKTVLQALPGTQASETAVENQTAVWRQPAVFCEFYLRNFVEFFSDFCFSGLHLRWPPGPGFLFYAIQEYPVSMRPRKILLSLLLFVLCNLGVKLNTILHC
jgi:hypothetical protein